LTRKEKVEYRKRMSLSSSAALLFIGYVHVFRSNL
jgi:hypothetical protein